MHVAVDVQFANDMAGLGVYTRMIARWLPRVSPETRWTFLGDTRALVRLREEIGPLTGTAVDFVNPASRSLIPTLPHLQEWVDYVSKFLDRHGFDVYFNPSFFSPAGDRLPRLAVMVHDLFCFTRHADFKGQRVDQQVAQRIISDTCSRADVILTPSNESAQELRRHFRLSLTRVRVIHHGIDARFAPQSPSAIAVARRRYGLPPQYLLLISGALSPRKNLDRLIQAYEYIRKRRLSLAPKLILVCKRLAENMDPRQLPAGVSVFPTVADSDLAPLISGACALVYPSLAEGFGFPVLEGLACGVPVVASDLPVFHEIANDFPIYVNPLEPASIAAGISKALDTPRSHLRVRAGSQHARRFTWRRCASSVLHTLASPESAT